MKASEHERATELLPWLVNGSLQGAELAWLSSHLSGCEQCRDEERRQQRVRDAVARQPVVELAPQASFKRLWARIEAQAGLPEDSNAHATAQPLPALRAARRHWGRVVAISVAASVVATLAVASLMLWQGDTQNSGNRYRTVASAAPAAHNRQIRVVFADAVTVADIKSILASAQLESTSGPSAAGVFTLQASGDRAQANLAALADSLRSDPRVRFAELR